MKIKINPTLHDATHATSPVPGGNAPVRHTFKLGLDVDMKCVVTAIQCDRGTIALPQKFSRERLIHWVKQQVSAGHQVHTVYEACGFGYTLHHQLTAAGAQSIITTPMQLSPERRRKNDRMDATQLCVRLSRHLDGHAHELRPIRIPTPQEEQRRELGRQRDFLVREVRRLENHGRARQSLDPMRFAPQAQWPSARSGLGRASGKHSPRSAPTSSADSSNLSWRRSVW